MNASDWTTKDDLRAMLHYLVPVATHADPLPALPRTSQRKLRLFACGCCWRVQMAWPDTDTCYKTLRAAENFADGKTTAKNLAKHRGRMAAVVREQGDHYGRCAAESLLDAVSQEPYLICAAARYASSAAAAYSGIRTWDEYRDKEVAAQVELLRDVIGNPFQPVTFEPEWLVPEVLLLANSIYDQRDWAAMPVLADLLIERGCAGERCTLCGGVGVLKGVEKKGGYEYGTEILYVEEPYYGDVTCPRCIGMGQVEHPIVEHLRGTRYSLARLLGH